MRSCIKISCLIGATFLAVEVFAQQIIRRPTTKSGTVSRSKAPVKKTIAGNTKKQEPQENITKGFVNLGLPSGTLWKATNETELYDYYSAVSIYGCNLPSQEQWTELKDYCKWSWTGNGYKVQGNNRAFIILPAAGYRSCSGSMSSIGSGGFYWSYTPSGSERAWGLDFRMGEVEVYSYIRCNELSVRLIQND